MPFSRDRRAVVYQRAKAALDVRPFGTHYDVYSDGYEWMAHSIAPRPVAKESFRIMIGDADCTQPYSASVLNISAMSFGALSANAIRALNGGAKKGGFAHDTGEGGYSPYIARTAATSSGRSARATSARTIPTAPSRARSSPRSPPTRRSRWSS